MQGINETLNFCFEQQLGFCNCKYNSLVLVGRGSLLINEEKVEIVSTYNEQILTSIRRIFCVKILEILDTFLI